MTGNNHQQQQQQQQQQLQRRIARKEQRKLRARHTRQQQVWFGLGTFGVVGWSVAIPTLSGLALGLWLDSRLAGGHSWTLMLLLAGILLGGWNAWYWVNREQSRISDDLALMVGDSPDRPKEAEKENQPDQLMNDEWMH
jgi:ATP synthase protein I